MTNKFLGYLLIILSLVITGCASRGSYEFGDFNQVGDPAPNLKQTTHSQRIVIIGGNSGIGLETTKLALTRGHQVTVVSRDPSNLNLSHKNLKTQSGNILSAQSMQSVLAKHDVVISAIGLPAGSSNVTLFSKGIQNVISAMQLHQINRLLTISAIGAGDSKNHGGLWFDWFLQPFVLTSDIDDKTRQEEIIKATKLDFTIIRPAILTDKSASNRYRVIQDYRGIETGKIARADVALFLIASIENDLYVRKTVVISD
ncbi:MAG: SDR family oxidoreductase [Gammaproteobacteria bacterium]|nr:SDR family oxidoreductase [Gammaproteobacteria bacterium]NNJ72363.1 SDR family oxidoreductase [Enterobacterales bacterium]